MSFVAVGIMGGLGLAKSLAVDAPRAGRQRKLAAETQRYSPWTGLKADPVQEADPVGSAMQGGMSGLAYSQNKAAADNANELQKAEVGWLNRQTTGAIPAGAQAAGAQAAGAAASGALPQIQASVPAGTPGQDPSDAQLQAIVQANRNRLRPGMDPSGGMSPLGDYNIRRISPWSIQTT